MQELQALPLHFQVQGDGFPLIVLHGFLGAADNWRNMAKRFAAHFQVYTIDLRNHGASPHSYEMTYAAMARDLEDYFAQENIDRAHILGHSMGGKVALQFAKEHPKSVRKLVIVDIAPKAYAPAHRELLAAMRQLDLKNFQSYSGIEQALECDIPDVQLRQFLVKNLTRNPDQSFRWRIGLDELIAGYDELTRAIEVNEIMDTPTCFIRAGKSRFIGDADIPAIQRMFSNVRIERIADAGHWVHVDAPEQFYDSVTGFLNRTGS